MEEENNIMKQVKNKTEEIMKKIVDKDIETIGSIEIESLYKLEDIHKDIANEEHWKRKENENMRYSYGNYGGNYGNYNGRRAGYDSYGNEYGRSYGRQGRDMRYRGDEQIDRMSESYGRYEEGREQYNRGNYGAKDDTLKSLEYMLQSAEDFFKMLRQDATSPEEMQLFQEYTQRIAQM